MNQLKQHQMGVKLDENKNLNCPLAPDLNMACVRFNLTLCKLQLLKSESKLLSVIHNSIQLVKTDILVQ